jgi:hypothetical protein
MDPASVRRRNFGIAAIHAVSTFGLVVWAIIEDDLPRADPSWWVDWSAWHLPFAGADWLRVNASDPVDRFYRHRPGSNATTVPVVWIAVGYAGWSAALHIVAANTPIGAFGWRVRWLDYIVTAPFMFVAIAALYGATSPLALLVAPIGIAIMIGVAAELERRDFWSLPVFLALAVPHLLAWSIVFKHIADAMVEDSSRPERGTAPAYVPVFTVITFLAFSSFAWVYYYRGVGTFTGDEAAAYYDVLSAVSKTTLHLFIGLGAIAQSGSLGTSKETAREMDSSTTLIIGAVGSVIIIAIGLWYGRRIRNAAIAMGQATGFLLGDESL